MKVRESGMPALDQWEAYFAPATIIERLDLGAVTGDFVEFGCGYGTFTLPVAALGPAVVHALDIEPAMLGIVARRALEHGLTNIELHERDFMRDGTGLEDGAVGCALLFNILHAENPIDLLREARRNVHAGGTVAVIHWNYDPETPRGPPLAIRPLPEHVAAWAEAADLERGPQIDLPPYHYGFALRRPDASA